MDEEMGLSRERREVRWKIFERMHSVTIREMVRNYSNGGVWRKSRGDVMWGLEKQGRKRSQIGKGCPLSRVKHMKRECVRS